MNMLLKAIYVCVTSANRWGKGLTVKEAKKNAGIPTKSDEKRVEFFVQAAVLNNPTDAELENLRTCIQVDEIGGSPKYYDYERSEEDMEQINRLHVGWLMVEKNTKG